MERHLVNFRPRQHPNFRKTILTKNSLRSKTMLEKRETDLFIGINPHSFCRRVNSYRAFYNFTLSILIHQENKAKLKI
jgi:hypothetical protein